MSHRWCTLTGALETRNFIYIFQKSNTESLVVKKVEIHTISEETDKDCELLILLPKSWTVQAYFKSIGLGRRSTEILRPMIPSANLGVGLTVSRNRPH